MDWGTIGFASITLCCVLFSQVIPDGESVKEISFIGFLLYVVVIQYRKEKEVFHKLADSNAMMMKGLRKISRCQNEQMKVLKIMNEKNLKEKKENNETH